jgi:hypothetical protein
MKVLLGLSSKCFLLNVFEVAVVFANWCASLTKHDCDASVFINFVIQVIADWRRSGGIVSGFTFCVKLENTQNDRITVDNSCPSNSVDNTRQAAIGSILSSFAVDAIRNDKQGDSNEFRIPSFVSNDCTGTRYTLCPFGVSR